MKCLALGYGVKRGLRNRIAGFVVIFAVVVGGTARAEDIRIAALGDSLTAGYGLADGTGLVPQLERWLRGQGAAVQVINAGVSGDTTAGGLARLDWTLTPDIDALIIELGANDMLRGIDPAVVRANLDGILRGARDRGLPVLLIGFEAPGNFGPDYKQAFDAIYPELAMAYGVLLMPSFFAALMADGVAANAAGLMQADGLHPNPAGVDLVVRTLGPLVLELVARTR